MVNIPPKLKAGDKVRFVSPASPAERNDVMVRAEILQSWGLQVDFARNAFNRQGYLAGSDEERLDDLNTAFRDPSVHAIFTTRGGKGSYRIADKLDFAAARSNPKFLIGFSDITALHLSLYKNAGLIGIHGALMHNETCTIPQDNRESLRNILMESGTTTLHARPQENTFSLTTSGIASGPLIGGNLDTLTTCAGWALPNLKGCILLLEAVNMHMGHTDRQLTLLRKAGHLEGINGIALGQFTDMHTSQGTTIFDLLKDHLSNYQIPILGGLPLGHGQIPLSVPLGLPTILNTNTNTLSINWPEST